MYTLKPNNLPKIDCVSLMKSTKNSHCINFFQVPLLCEDNKINSDTEWKPFTAPGFVAGKRQLGYINDQPILCSEADIDKLKSFLGYDVVKTPNTAILTDFNSTSCHDLVIGSAGILPTVSNMLVPIVPFLSYNILSDNMKVRFMFKDPSKYGRMILGKDSDDIVPNVSINVLEPLGEFHQDSNPCFCHGDKGFAVCDIYPNPYMSSWSNYFRAKINQLSFSLSYTFSLIVLSDSAATDKRHSIIPYGSLNTSNININIFNDYALQTTTYTPKGNVINDCQLVVIPSLIINDRSSFINLPYSAILDQLNITDDPVKQVVSAFNGRVYKCHPEFDIVMNNYDGKYVLSIFNVEINISKSLFDLNSYIRNYDMASLIRQAVPVQLNSFNYYITQTIGVKTMPSEKIPDYLDMLKYNEHHSFKLY